MGNSKQSRPLETRRDVLKKGVLAGSALLIGGTGTVSADLGDGRVGHYTLNNLHYNVDKGEKTEDLVFDASPEKNHGKWEGDGDPLVSGAVGNAFDLTGGDDFVNIPLGENIFPDDSVTLAAWVKPDNLDARQDYVSRIYSFASTSDSGSNGQIKLGINANGILQVAGIDEEGTVRVSNADGMPLTTGTWHHVAGVFDGTSAEIFVDGSPVQLSTQDTWESLNDDSTTPVRIGARGDNTFYANARIDEVRVYNRALSGDEVTDLYEMKE